MSRAASFSELSGPQVATSRVMTSWTFMVGLLRLDWETEASCREAGDVCEAVETLYRGNGAEGRGTCQSTSSMLESGTTRIYCPKCEYTAASRPPPRAANRRRSIRRSAAPLESQFGSAPPANGSRARWRTRAPRAAVRSHQDLGDEGSSSRSARNPS